MHAVFLWELDPEFKLQPITRTSVKNVTKHSRLDSFSKLIKIMVYYNIKVRNHKLKDYFIMLEYSFIILFIVSCAWLYTFLGVLVWVTQISKLFYCLKHN